MRAELVVYPSGVLQTLEKKRTTIGRYPDNDIVIEESHVSHKHCRVLRSGNDYFIEDLESSNGTYINGVRIEGRTRLHNNDLISFGRDLPAYKFRLLSGLRPPQK